MLFAIAFQCAFKVAFNEVLTIEPNIGDPWYKAETLAEVVGTAFGLWLFPSTDRPDPLLPEIISPQ